MISDFLYHLSTQFDSVSYSNVAGNHSRLSKKDEAVKDERFDDLIGWYVKKSLSHIRNFSFVDTVDNTFSPIVVEDQTYFICHGDYDSFSKNGISNLVLATGYKPAGVLFGHYHTPAMQDVSDVKLIGSGCLCGSGDDYTVTKRLIGSPSQTVLVCDKNGIECMYPVSLL